MSTFSCTRIAAVLLWVVCFAIVCFHFFFVEASVDQITGLHFYEPKAKMLSV